MYINQKTHPRLWLIDSELSAIERTLGFLVNDEAYEKFRSEADRVCSHLSVAERDAWAAHVAREHPCANSNPVTAVPDPVTAVPDPAAAVTAKPRSELYWRIVTYAALLLLAFLLGTKAAKCEPEPANAVPVDSTLHALIVRPGMLADGSVQMFRVNLWQIAGANVSSSLYDSGDTAIRVNCAVGCSATSGFADNSAFTVGSTTINVMGGYYTTGAAPSLTSGNAGRVRIDANSYLAVDCIVGCAGGSTTPADAFANPTTAGLQFDLLAGFNGTTWDRLRVDASKNLDVNVNAALPAGTNVIGHVVVDSAPTTAVTGIFWQTTQPVSIATMPTTPVTGTFFQATQPVSLAAALPAGTNVLGHIIADSGSTTAVTSLPAIPAGTNVIGHVIADSGSTTAVTSLPSIPAGTNAIGSITNTGFAVTGTLPAGSNVIGGVTASGNFAQGETTSAGTNQAHIGCDKSVVYDASTNGSTQLVALVSGEAIHLCGYVIFSAGTANVKLTYGTGTACATGTTSLTPAFQLVAQTGNSYGNGEGTIATGAASNALCINSSAAVAVQALVTYAQF